MQHHSLLNSNLLIFSYPAKIAPKSERNLKGDKTNSIRMVIFLKLHYNKPFRRIKSKNANCVVSFQAQRNEPFSCCPNVIQVISGKPK